VQHLVFGNDVSCRFQEFLTELGRVDFAVGIAPQQRLPDPANYP
jgi:hypothetical protein